MPVKPKPYTGTQTFAAPNPAPAAQAAWQPISAARQAAAASDPALARVPGTPQYQAANAQATADQAQAAQQGYRESSAWGGSQATAAEYAAKIGARQASAAGYGTQAGQGYYGASRGYEGQYGKQVAALQDSAAQYREMTSPEYARGIVSRQAADAGYLRGVGMGTRPSLAQLQMQQGQADALASNLAIAGSGRGGSSGAMLDQALRQNAAQQQGFVSQGAQLRAQESMQALQAAAAIDASRFGQMDALAARGQSQEQLALGALGQQASLGTGAFTGAADIDLGYRGLDRSYEDLLFQQGNAQADRFTSTLTADQSRALQRYMYDQDAAVTEENARYAVYGGIANTAGQLYGAYSGNQSNPYQIG